MNALQHHALAHLLAARRRRDHGRRDDEITERSDGRALVDAHRPPARSTLDALR